MALRTTRSFSTSIRAAYPRLNRPPNPSQPISDIPKAPYPWFIPKSSSTAPVSRPSFLPPPPRSAFSDDREIPNPPYDLPSSLHPLYNYLWSLPLLVDHGPTFIETSRPARHTIPILDHPPPNGRRRRGPIDGGPGIGGLAVGGWWDWAVVCQVEGRGVGDVRRAEAAIREWLSKNPITLHGTSNVPTKTPRPSKKDAASEWALIDTGVGAVVHVMTERARTEQDVEGVWANVDR